jgi:hypothetical protein
MGASRSLPTFLFCLETWGEAYAHELRWSSWAATGLSDVMSSAFAGVDKMLIGKKFPICMRALRMVVEVILDPVINDPSAQSYDNFIANLEARAGRVGFALNVSSSQSY